MKNSKEQLEGTAIKGFFGKNFSGAVLEGFLKCIRKYGRKRQVYGSMKRHVHSNSKRNTQYWGRREAKGEKKELTREGRRINWKGVH